MNFRVIYLNGCGSRCIRICSWKPFERITDVWAKLKKNNEIRTAKVSVLSRLLPLDSYDFILLARVPTAESVVLTSRVD